MNVSSYYNNYIEKTGGVVQFNKNTNEVTLLDVTPKQCQDAIINTSSKYGYFILERSSPDIPSLLIPALLKIRSVYTIAVIRTTIKPDVIHSFSSQLSNNHTLTRLSIRNDSIDDEGVTALVQSLKCNTTLKYLTLNDNQGVTSASIQSLLELIVTNNTIVQLELRHNKIDTNGILILVESLKTNKTLQHMNLDPEHKQAASSLPYYKTIESRVRFF